MINSKYGLRDVGIPIKEKGGCWPDTWGKKREEGDPPERTKGGASALAL